MKWRTIQQKLYRINLQTNNSYEKSDRTKEETKNRE